MIAVLDASAGVRTIIGSKCEQELTNVLGEVDRVIAPCFYRLEVVSALKHYVDAGLLEQKHMVSVLDKILALVDEYIPDDTMLPELLHESIRLQHSPYDILYLTLARRNAAALVTLDKKLSKLAAKEGLWVYLNARPN